MKMDVFWAVFLGVFLSILTSFGVVISVVMIHDRWVENRRRK